MKCKKRLNLRSNMIIKSIEEYCLIDPSLYFNPITKTYLFSLSEKILKKRDTKVSFLKGRKKRNQVAGMLRKKHSHSKLTARGYAPFSFSAEDLRHDGLCLNYDPISNPPSPFNHRKEIEEMVQNEEWSAMLMQKRKQDCKHSSMVCKKEIKYEGKTYTWDGNTWFDSDYIIPPTNIISKLNAFIVKELPIEDDLVSNIRKLFLLAQSARANKQFDRAEKIVRKILLKSPENLAAITLLSSMFREKGEPQKAIDETNAFSNTRFCPLIISRAAAFCDLQKWRLAKKEVARALRIKPNKAAFLVVQRIKKYQPDLYKK